MTRRSATVAAHRAILDMDDPKGNLVTTDLTDSGQCSADSLPLRASRLVQPLSDDLARRLPAGTPLNKVTTHVATALRDLDGSVSFDVLPEMAARLAEHRLHQQQA